MIRACHLGMCNGDYYFLYAWLLEPVNDEWRRGDEFDAIAKEAYKYMIHVRCSCPTSLFLSAFKRPFMTVSPLEFLAQNRLIASRFVVPDHIGLN